MLICKILSGQCASYALGVGYRLLISKQLKLLLLLKYGTTAVINDRSFTYACIEDTVYSLYVYD
jgi:hypothetical protein